jgi:hypothetical protein
LAGRAGSEKIRSWCDISSDSFVLTADKSRIPLTISKFVNAICFGACKSLVRANIWIPRPEKRPAGDGIPKAAGKAQQLMKNLPRGGCRKFSSEDFYFQLLQRTMFLCNPTLTRGATFCRASGANSFTRSSAGAYIM